VTSSLPFWIFAFADLVVATVLALAGVRAAKRGDWIVHRRLMYAAGAALGLFLLLYVGKVFWLGHEPIASWSLGRRVVLWIHELFAASMLVFGIAARLAARPLAPSLAGGEGASATLRHRRRHRLLGRLAVASAVLALMTGTVVLAGMLEASRPGPDSLAVHAAVAAAPLALGLHL
jgi:uncharacterized membrane protein YozB (DUF420 family)